ncbi:cytochrome c oxidase assembly factor 3, mitochondrial [Microplitis demolitor]|uniref:cytochrome c oxidase assembly factor 3, mitochondrial n=1 Tax=Microplitis demolitor TaxID=69319 RepID=UPI0004CD10B5|nr:cytochrome c oxidase assembly factor 3, mitochondrial [Microplitis demolitor]
MDNEEMPKIDLSKGKSKLSTVDRHFMEKLEKLNIERAIRMKGIRRANRYTGCGLFAGVIAIYTYTIFAVKQETFLDDFEIPETISTEEA